MPLCTLLLISLSPSTSIPTFLSALEGCSPPIKPLIASRVIRWIIEPTSIDTDMLLHPPSPWDLLLLLPSTSGLPPSLNSHVRNTYSLTAGIPSRLLLSFQSKNNDLLHPSTAPAPASSPSPSSSTSPSTSSSTSQLRSPTPSPSSTPQELSSQNLELSPPLQSWTKSFSTTVLGQSPLTMLNLLSFHAGAAAKKSYQQYGAAFAQSIGSRHGGNAKIVGNVVVVASAFDSPSVSSSSPSPSPSPPSASNPTTTNDPKWQEIALAQYPSISHFAAMLASDDYQRVNRAFRLPSLRDTCILCTSEIAVEKEKEEWERGKGRERSKL